MSLMNVGEICAICADQYSQFADLFPLPFSLPLSLVSSHKQIAVEFSVQCPTTEPAEEMMAAV